MRRSYACNCEQCINIISSVSFLRIIELRGNNFIHSPRLIEIVY